MRSLARRVLAAEYALLRTPLAVLDSKVVDRLPERSRLRATVKLALGSLDGLAEQVLRESPPERPASVDSREQAAVARAVLAEVQQHRPDSELTEADERELAAVRAKHRVQELAEERRLKETEPERVGPAAEMKKAAAKKAPAAAAKKSAAKKAPAKKTAAEKAPAKNAAAKKPPARRAPAKKSGQ